MVLVDTTIWSLALRRQRRKLSSDERLLIAGWVRLVEDGTVTLIGPIRQEVLSGIRSQRAFETLSAHLDDFPHIPILPRDYDCAANFFNRCRAKGISGTSIDMLICAVASRARVPIFTTDSDFSRYARHVSISLYAP